MRGTGPIPITLTASIMVPPRVGPTDRGYGLFTDVLDDYLYLDLLLAAAIHVVVLRHLEIFIYAISVLAFAAIELVYLAVFGSNPDEIVPISTVENVHTWGTFLVIFSQLLST